MSNRKISQSTFYRNKTDVRFINESAKYKFLFIYIVLYLFTSQLSGVTEVIDIYFQDYEIANRTVIHLSDLPNYDVQELPSQSRIVVTIYDTKRAPTVPLIQEMRLSPIVKSIRTQGSGRNDTKITITTHQPYYLEYYYLSKDRHRIVFDIFTKREPETRQELEQFINFFNTVGYNERAEKLAADFRERVLDRSFEDHTEDRSVISRKEDTLISLSKSFPFIDAIGFFSTISIQKEGKPIINLTDIGEEPIGFDVEKIHWKAALSSILTKHNVKITEQSDYYLLQKEVSKEDLKADLDVIFDDNVVIEATFFEADFNVVRELGIDWGTIMGGRIRIGADIRSTDQLTQELLSVRANETFETGGTTIDVNTLFKAFAASDKGHIISRPQITVLSGETGTVQDGTDYTILVPGRTALGEEVAQANEVSVQSGTIVNVTPTVFLDKDGDKAINMVIRVERSSAQPDVTGFSKKTAEVESRKILYDGEETIIGGLLAKETVSVRKGVPFLKDLPWWFLGIRYLTGHNRYQQYNKELVILIKASIMPSVEERKRIQRRVVSEDINYQRQQLKEIELKLIE